MRERKEEKKTQRMFLVRSDLGLTSTVVCEKGSSNDDFNTKKLTSQRRQKIQLPRQFYFPSLQERNTFNRRSKNIVRSEL